MNIDVKLSKFQREFISRSDEDLLVLATGISAGKSKVAGLWVVLETLKKQCRIIAAAQSFKALSEVLFREIKYWLNTFGIKYSEKFGQKITLANGSEIFGASAENPEGILGFTDISAALIDEAAYCPEELYNYIGDRMRGGDIKPKYRLISSPSNQMKARWFTDLCARNPTKVIHATALDNPFTSDEFKQSLKDRYGVGSNLYRQQVLGEFIDGDSSDALLKSSDFSDISLNHDTEYVLGCDLSRFGVDRTVIIVRNSYEIVETVILHQNDTFEIAAQINKLYNKYHNIKASFLDGTGGYSSGVFDQLKLQHNNIFEINFGSKSKDPMCSNMRAYMYRKLANSIKSGFFIGKNSELKDELLAQRLKLNERGLFQLVSKDEIKEYLGRSPDLADALALTYAEPAEVNTGITANDQKRYIRMLFR